MAEAMFGAGCFWGVESTFSKIDGVSRTAVGYAGGTSENPTYEDVCGHDTGHAEVVQVKFDPEIVSYEALLNAFWDAHDPTTLNRQGPDRGAQYRSCIFAYGEEQLTEAENSKASAQSRFQDAIVTEIAAAPTFWRAEEYHQKYFEKQGVDACPI